MSDIREILNERILVLDGAMGTMIQAHDLNEDDFRNENLKDHPQALQGNNDLLSITRPDIIKEIHTKFLEAGADIIETNTFTATSIGQADYGLEDMAHEMNRQSAFIACEVARAFTKKDPEKPRFVAGSIGPTNKTASISPEVNEPGYRAIDFDRLTEAYREQAAGLQEGGVDIFLIETVFDTLNAKAALYAIDDLAEETGKRIPVMLSGTITDASGRTLSGQTTEAFLISVTHMPLLSIGLNCALGAKELRPYLHVLSKKSDTRVSAHPNAGLPNEFGEYEQTPAEMGKYIKEFLEDGLLNIVGGCCGTTPEHIKVISDLVKNYKPREIPEPV